MNEDGHTVSLRALLSHTAGATVGGFPGYPAGTDLPTNREVVAGSERTNTDPVTIKANPEREFNYSGGGFQIAQLWAEETSGEEFAALMQRLVLGPVGMTLSTFEQPLTDTQNVAAAHTGRGEPVEGGWHSYPEQAAAGLWTTPTDYLRFVSALMAAAGGDGSAGLPIAAATAVTTPVSSDYGLGLGVNTLEDGRTVWRHGGANRGYRCFVQVLPGARDAVVVMTNGSGGSTVAIDVMRTLNTAYGWPGEAPRTIERVAVTPKQLATYTGRYVLEEDPDVILTVAVQGQDLTATDPEGRVYRLVPIGEGRFVTLDDGEKVTFTAEDETMVAMFGRFRAVREATE